MSERPGEECTGQGTCHGCLGWCSICGTVSHVCDFPECDWHRRPEDVQRDLDALRRDFSDTAKKDWERERRLGQDNREFRSWARSAASELRRMEKEEAELEEELEATMKAGSLLKPRRSKQAAQPEDDRQLRLF